MKRVGALLGIEKIKNQAENLSISAEWSKDFESSRKIDDAISNPVLTTYSMKFPKPRVLTENNYPDADISQPKLFKKLVNEVIYPPETSPLDKYIDTTVSFLKEKIRLKNKKVDVNLNNLGESLFFAKLCLKNQNTHNAVRALIDTGLRIRCCTNPLYKNII